MKRIAALSAALALSAAAGIAQAQVSQDDFSVLVGPNARPVVSNTPVQRPSQTAIDSLTSYQQGIVGPQAAHANSTVTRAQVKAELEQARAEGKLEPAYTTLSNVAAPGVRAVPASTSFAGGKATPAGQ